MLQQNDIVTRHSGMQSNFVNISTHDWPRAGTLWLVINNPVMDQLFLCNSMETKQQQQKLFISLYTQDFLNTGKENNNTTGILKKNYGPAVIPKITTLTYMLILCRLTSTITTTLNTWISAALELMCHVIKSNLHDCHRAPSIIRHPLQLIVMQSMWATSNQMFSVPFIPIFWCVSWYPTSS